MKKIILDLEFTNIPKDKVTAGARKQEIIQIGAVKLNENNEIIDEFNMLVKPEFGKISPRIEKLTHITNEDVCDKAGFAESLDAFLSWVGSGDETEIYSWSFEDYYQISGEAKLKKYHNERLGQLFENWKDLQGLFGEKLGITRKLRLDDVINGCNLRFEGVQHSALDDAFNTAKIFQIMDNEKTFCETFKSIIEMVSTKERVYFPFEELLRDFNVVCAGY